MKTSKNCRADFNYGVPLGNEVRLNQTQRDFLEMQGFDQGYRKAQKVLIEVQMHPAASTKNRFEFSGPEQILNPRIPCGLYSKNF
jgi:hypothetical protein